MQDYETKIRSRIKAYEQCLEDLKNGEAYDYEEVLIKYGIGSIDDPWYLCDSLYNTLNELCGLLGEKWEGERENYLAR